MSINTEPSQWSLVLTDAEQNYYVIPAELFAQGRVPAEQKAEIEAQMREHEVMGHNPLAIFAAGVFVGGTVTVAGVAVGATVATLGVVVASRSGFVPGPNDDPNSPILR